MVDFERNSMWMGEGGREGEPVFISGTRTKGVHYNSKNVDSFAINTGNK